MHFFKNGNFGLLPFLQPILSLVLNDTTIHTAQTRKEESLWFPPFPSFFLIYHISKPCYISKTYFHHYHQSRAIPI